MRRAALSLLLLFLCVATASGAARTGLDEAGRSRLFLEGIHSYEAGDYAAAARSFQELAQDGVRNGKLYYDLGNAYLKARDLGRAILWYERARLLTPSDPDLRFNLDYARGLTRDAAGSQGLPLGRVLFFWRYQLGDATVRDLAIAFNAVLWSALAVLAFWRRRWLKQIAVLAGCLAAVFVLTAAYDAYDARTSTEAVILPAEVAVRAGLTEDSTELFRLHAGAPVQADRTQKGHVRIRFSRDRIGWVPADTVGMVREK